MKKILGLGMLSVSAITLSAGAALADYELLGGRRRQKRMLRRRRPSSDRNQSDP
jgi:hypothetical protein